MSKLLSDFFENCFPIDPCSDNIQLIAKLPSCRGVLFFTDARDLPVLLVTTANIRSYVRNRLFSQQPSRDKKAELAGVTRRVYYCCSYCEFKSSLRHCQIAKALYPDSYRDLVNFPRLWYVKINLKTNWPCFSVTDKPFYSETTKAFGPFPTRRAAAEFTGILTESLALCRQPKLIDNPQKAAACPYLQMRTCPGPCLGRISRQEYLEQIDEAISVAQGNITATISKLKGKMHHLAAQKDFESAQAIKNRLQQLDLLSKNTYRWVTDLSRLAILHIDKSARIKVAGKRKKTQTYSAFLIKPDYITEFTDFTIEETDVFHQSFLSQLNRPIGIVDFQQLPERLAIPGYFLYRSSSPGIWIDCSKPHKVPTAEEIKEAICKRFECPA